MNGQDLNVLAEQGDLKELMVAVKTIAEKSTKADGIQSPEDAAALVMYDLSALENEELWVILLDTRNVPIKIEHLYKGSLNSSAIRIGEMFRAAIRENAAAIIVCHNHPSGDPTPSPEDTAVTKLIVEAGDLLDVTVLDHLVIGEGRFVSMKARKLGFD